LGSTAEEVCHAQARRDVFARHARILKFMLIAKRIEFEF